MRMGRLRHVHWCTRRSCADAFGCDCVYTLMDAAGVGGVWRAYMLVCALNARGDGFRRRSSHVFVGMSVLVWLAHCCSLGCIFHIGAVRYGHAAVYRMCEKVTVCIHGVQLSQRISFSWRANTILRYTLAGDASACWRNFIPGSLLL